MDHFREETMEKSRTFVTFGHACVHLNLLFMGIFRSLTREELSELNKQQNQRPVGASVWGSGETSPCRKLP